MKELHWKSTLVRLPRQDSVYPEVLRPNDGTQILPLWIFRVRRRLNRTGTNVAESAGHSNSIGSDEFLIVVIRGVVVEALRIPFLRSLFIKIGIGKQTQTYN